MTPTDARERLELLQALVEPAASMTTDRLFRELLEWIDEQKSMAERAPETPPDE
jgi:hypothetical protein